MSVTTVDLRQNFRAVSDQDLLAAVPAIAKQLGDATQLKEVPVATLLPRGLGLYASQFAVISKQRFFLPIDPDNPRDRIEFLLNDSKASAVLVDQNTKQLVENLDLNCNVIDISLLDIADDGGLTGSLEDLLNCQPNDLAYMIYTSGSTGRPKGVPIHWEAFDNHNQWFIDEFQVTANDRCAQIASVGFDISLEEIFPTFRAGATLVPVTKLALESAHEFFRWVEDQQLTILNIPTALWHNFVLHLSDFDLPDSVRLVLIGGEKVNPQRVKDWFERVPSDRVRLINAYGPTEVTITSTFCELSEDKLDSIGKPIRNIDCHLIDENGNEITQANVPGEVYFSGVGVAGGYWYRPEQTKKAFLQCPSVNNNQRCYRTGDRAKFDEDGDLHFLGRQDNQVKLRGYRIEVDEIATAVCRHEGIKDAVVRKVTGHREYLVCFAKTDADADTNLLESQVKDFLAGVLPRYMVPQRFCFHAKFPMTVGGKIDTKRLLAELQDDETVQAFNDWQSETQKQVALAWEAALGHAPESPDMTFDECGGDSLAAMSYAGHLEKTFGRRIGVSTLLGYPSVAKMAGFLESEDDSDRASTSTPLISLIGCPAAEAETAIVFFHPAGGGGYLYNHFVNDRILDKYTIVIVDSPFLTGEIPGDGHDLDVETITQQYLAALTKVLRPDMNLVLVGYSFGALLAWEAGLALQGSSFKIANVINIDQPVIAAMRQSNLFKRIGNWRHRLKKPLQTWLDIQNVRQQNKVRRQSDRGELKESHLDQSKSLQLEDFYVQIEEAYQPSPGKLPLHLIRGDIFEAKYSLPNDYGWGEVSADLKISRVSGTHSTLFRGSYLEKLTRAFEQAIDSGEPHV